MKILIVLLTLTYTSLGLAPENTEFFRSVSGKVSAGNFTYYSLINKGPVSIYLVSRTGDADLYVSQLLSHPDYEPENYCLHSATCGVDVVHIPSSFKRPVGIGIFGHPSHEESEYILGLKLYREEPDPIEESDPYSGTFFDEKADRSREFDKDVDEFTDSEENRVERPYLFSFILTLIDILFEVFFM